MARITVINATNFFNRDSYIYSIGDIKLPRPLPLNRMFYVMIFLAVWSFPYFLLFGSYIGTNLALHLVLMFGPAIGLGVIATKQLAIFNNKNLFDFTKTLYDYSMSEPKGWNDGKSDDMKPQKYHVFSEILISRRRELAVLADSIVSDDRVAEFVDDKDDDKETQRQLVAS